MENTPKDREFVYGVGSARMSTTGNSKHASYGFALSNLASKLYPVIDEAVAEFVSADNAEAYEKIKTTATSFFTASAQIDEVWIDNDGTVWTLISAPVNDFPNVYKTAAEDYLEELEEKRTVTLEKLDDILSSLDFTESDGGAVSSDLLLFREKAEKKADEIIRNIDRIENSFNSDSVVERIRIILKRVGYKVD